MGDSKGGIAVGGMAGQSAVKRGPLGVAMVGSLFHSYFLPLGF